MKKKFDLIDYNDYVEDFTEYDFSPKELVVMKCHECCGYQSNEVKLCPAKGCPLYPLKLKWYKAPKRKRELTEERRKQLQDHARILGSSRKK